MNIPFPWQRSVWERLWTVRQASRLPHALLMSAPSGSGLTEFSTCLSRAVLCHAVNADGTACDTCQSCRLFAVGNHPDYVEVTTEEDATTIKTHQIRALGEFFSIAGQYSSRRVVVLDPADRLNLNAANSLLKTLEEPPLGCLLILLSAYPMTLPITIRSRCQHYRFARTAETAKLDWLRTQAPKCDPLHLLALADYAPIAALELAGSSDLEERDRLLSDLESLSQGRSDPFVVAGRWSALEFRLVSSWLLKLIEDLIRLGVHEASPTVANKDQISRLRALAKIRPLHKLFAARDLLLQDQRLLAAISSLNALNFYEEFTMNWVGNLSPAKSVSKTP